MTADGPGLEVPVSGARLSGAEHRYELSCAGGVTLFDWDPPVCQLPATPPSVADTGRL